MYLEKYTLFSALPAACKELATSYTNTVVKGFEQKLLYFLNYKLQNEFKSLPRKDVNSICRTFCYQFICQGEPRWPKIDSLTDNIKSKIETFCSLEAETAEKKYPSRNFPKILVILYLSCYPSVPTWNKILTTLLKILKDPNYFPYYQDHL
ncbi:hypothetical protein CLU79DRAFT_7384 [Phycomyces nitens]|nr:hypothetical protein CLU79DRAFT_7384 [Phycomyces nitens]